MNLLIYLLNSITGKKSLLEKQAFYSTSRISGKESWKADSSGLVKQILIN